MQPDAHFAPRQKGPAIAADYLDDSRSVFGHYPRMQRLEIPRRATINESPQLARLVGEAEREKGEIEFDCSKTEAWGPFGVALLASCLEVRRKLGRATKFTGPTEGEARQAFEETGLGLLADGQAEVLNGGQVHPIAIEPRRDSSALAADLSSPLGEIVGNAPAVVKPCLQTMLDNLFEWSKSEVGGFVVVRWHKKTRQVRFAVVDRGLGIPAVLRRAQVGNLIRSSDIEVIEAAFSDPTVTSRHEGQQGLGLKQLRDTVLAHKGKITVVSLGAKISWSTDKVNRAASPPLRGTAIEIELSP